MKKILMLAVIGLAAMALLLSAAFAKSSKSESAWLGVYTQSVDRDMAEAFDLETSWGAVVNEVIDDSPADDAGLRDDDVIIEFNNQKITDSEDLVDAIQDANPGDRVRVVVVRDGDKEAFTVELGEKPSRFDRTEKRKILKAPRYYFSPDAEDAPDAPKAPKAGKAPNVWYSPDKHDVFTYRFEGNRGYIGVSLNDLNEQLGEYFGVSDGAGALITEVAEDSPAEKAGLKAGDIIVAIGSEEVEDYDDVIEIVGEQEPGDEIEVKVLRNSRKMSVEVSVGEREEDLVWNSYLDIDPMVHMPKIRRELQDGLEEIELIVDMQDMRKGDIKDLKKLEKELKLEIKKMEQELRKAMEELRKELRD